VTAIETLVLSGTGLTSLPPNEIATDRAAGVTALRRVLAPVKVLVDRTLLLDDAWFVRDHGVDWRRLSDQARDTDALLQSLYDRLAAVHDFVTERLSRQMNSVLYRLTVFSTILLPVTAITGLLGMNVGVAGASYRFMGGSLAFVLVVTALVVLALFEYRFMRIRNLLQKMGQPPAPPSAPVEA
jgi:Mg2+ and Co2+ transporter CorA